MGASMFVLSWIGMRGAPPNPQAKMMSVHDAGDVHGAVPQLRVGAEPLLRRAEHRGDAAAMAARAGAGEGRPVPVGRERRRPAVKRRS